ncbi:MAG: DUF4147 domain-containing protein [Euryhalocaulis sp.]|uniref:glycerate kinase type-2 family protein n=1 Tax=Euryhalocaulis sp. TaxID=2744307 RepID=UPI0017FFFFEB|nr:DUF4147 domain-containing protein [Euryhalocaulis sp.]MBA4800925.1 DUF4147 domain-containing protein [Euryhalocaulis sp.]
MRTTLPSNAASLDPGDPRGFLRSLLAIALDAVNPAARMGDCLPEPPKGRTLVLGAGKASALMAEALEALWPGKLSGEVVVPDGYERPLRRIRVETAGHPVPDARSAAAARRALAQAAELGSDDLLIALISGGGSALWCAPRGVAREEKADLLNALMSAGAPIGDLNAVRGALSDIKAGGLARAAFPARLATFVISDVPGDDPALVASGPTVPGPARDPAAILQRWNVPPPARWPAQAEGEAARGPVRLIGSAREALAAASRAAERAGVNVEILGEAIEGDAETVARDHARKIRAIPAAEGPLLLLSGGEVTAPAPAGSGRGGPNTHYALALALALDRAPGIFALAADTDGLDGRAEGAGAYVGPATLPRAVEAGLDPAAMLAGFDSASLFDDLGDKIITGPTGVNVTDFRAILLNQRFINRD